MKKLLVFTSTFPRWKNDTTPPFVLELSKRMTDDFKVSILTPNFPKSKSFEELENIKIFRFRYFLRKYETLAGSGGILPALKKNKLNYFKVPFFLMGEFLALRKYVRKYKPDIIHSHWILPQGIICYLIKKMYGIPYVITTHGGDIFGLRNKLAQMLKKITLRNAKRITVVSNAIKKEIKNTLDEKLNVDIIPMGVDSNLFNQKPNNEIRKKYNINGTFLIFVGRLAEKKGVEYLLKAMPKIIENHKDIKLMIIGEGHLKSSLEELTKKLNIEKNIIFTGAIKNELLPEYYAEADLFVGPSIIAKGGDTEGLGLTFVEAGLSNCILVGSNIGGIPDVINENTGVLTKEKDSEDIYIKIDKLLNDKKEFNRIKKSVRNELMKFDWKTISKKYIKILNS